MTDNQYEAFLISMIDEVAASRLQEADLPDAMLAFSTQLTASLPADVVQRDIHNLPN